MRRLMRLTTTVVVLVSIAIAVVGLGSGCSGRTPKAKTPADTPPAEESPDQPAEVPSAPEGDLPDAAEPPVQREYPDQAWTALEGVPWTMTGVTSEDGGDLVEPVPSGAPTITFSNGTVAGNSGLNSFSGDYKLDGNRLKLAAASVTKNTGSVDMADQESAFFAALGKTARYEIAEGRLRLLAEDGSTLLEFAKP